MLPSQKQRWPLNLQEAFQTSRSNLYKSLYATKHFTFFIKFQVMWIYREISAPVIFVTALLEPNIRWRTKYFRLKWGGLVEPLPLETKHLM